MAIFASIMYFPDLRMFKMASSIATNVRLHNCEGIPSFTLLLMDKRDP